MNRPWLKFYPADWRADPRLRMCSLAARGLWIDLISYMHEGQPYGHLTIDGAIPSIENIASLVARPLSEIRKALAELESMQVFSRDKNGAIYSRRMVKDHDKATRDSENGKGGGNPKIAAPVNQGVNPPDKAQKLEARPRNDDGGDAGARGQSMFTPEAKQLCDDLLRIQRLEADDPRCIASLYAVQAWLTKGWDASVIREAIDVVMSKRPDAPSALRYFEKAIAAAHAERARPLPEAVILPMERVNVRPGTQTVSPLIAAADELVARTRADLATVRGEGELRERAGSIAPGPIPAW